WWRTKAYDMGNPSTRKEVTKIIAYAQDAQDLQLGFRAMDRNRQALMPFKPIGALKDTITMFDKKIDGYYIQFEGREYSTRPPFRFYGLTALWDTDATATANRKSK